MLDKSSRLAAAELWDAKSAQEDGSPVQKWVGAIPFPSIREVRVGEKGERIEEFVGQIEIRRRGFVTTIDKEEREKLAGESANRKTGDPGIEWEIGCMLIFCLVFLFVFSLSEVNLFMRSMVVLDGNNHASWPAN